MTERDPSQAPTPEPTPAPDDAPTVVWSPGREGVVDEAAPETPEEPVRDGGGNRVRWGIALVVTVLMVGVAAAAVLLLTGQSAPSSLVGYAPSSSVVYGELRLDLPGDQRQKLGQFLSRFPGFKDQANLATKYDEVLDRVVLALTSGRQEFTRDIKPWFAGELAFSVSELPTDLAAGSGTPRFLLLASVTDAGKARAWLDALAADASPTVADHAGTPIVLVGGDSKPFAYAIADAKAMVVGDEASVRAAIDTKGDGGLPNQERFTAAQQSFRGDALGYVYIDAEGYLAWLRDVMESMPGGSMGFVFDDAYLELVPEWMIFRLQARGDSIAMELASPHVDAGVDWTNRESRLAPHLPPSTIVLLDGHQVGESLLKSIDMYRQNPGTAEAFESIDQAAALLGGFEGILGWMEDAGFVLTRDGSTVDGGVVFSPKDRAAAERLLSILRSYATIGGGGAGLQVEVRDEPYAGTTITVIDFGDWRDIAAMGGASATDIPFEGRLEVAYAATDQVIVLALGDSFVKAVLDAKPGASLADDARFRSLMDRVGSRNASALFIDITAVREIIEGLAREADPTAFELYVREYQPYLVPLDAYVQSATVDGGLDRSTGVIVVK